MSPASSGASSSPGLPTTRSFSLLRAMYYLYSGVAIAARSKRWSSARTCGRAVLSVAGTTYMLKREAKSGVGGVTPNGLSASVRVGVRIGTVSGGFGRGVWSGRLGKSRCAGTWVAQRT